MLGIGSTVGNAGERCVRERVHCRERWREGLEIGPTVGNAENLGVRKRYSKM